MRRISRFAAPLVLGGRSCATTRGDDASRTERKEDVVTPWGVAATGPRGVDYDRVLALFGSEPVDEPLLQRLEETRNGREEHAQATGTAQGEAGQMALHPFFSAAALSSPTGILEPPLTACVRPLRRGHTARTCTLAVDRARGRCTLAIAYRFY
ncbi:putative tryptophanyl-tRNA synthetase [Trypanosoma cruzi]|uniref:Putative tryptophanyl-tRNA synthetase n=1 Tax=Trypanosoma cruzi TaxID=5693 RepID=A0A2V2W2K9_TRYCR|nr:putative tryptophanyl-tRNA synthetase [Trypanosoma cruzi]